MKCEMCSKKEATDEHHIDGDHKNNSPENIQKICVLCHAKLHGISPKKSELRRLVIMRDRLIKQSIVINNQIRGFSRIEYAVPGFFASQSKNLDKETKGYEKRIKKMMKKEDYPIWAWLGSVYGISEVTAAKLISHIDIENTPTVSAMWRYCGLDATRIKRTKGMSEEKAKQYGNPYLKKELLGILGKQFMRKKSPYRKIYEKEKERQAFREYPEGELQEVFNKQKKKDGYKKADTRLTKGHAHNRAIRKAVKFFLADLWMEWRKTEGLPVSEPYKPTLV